MRRARDRQDMISYIAAGVLFLAMLAMLLFATRNFSSDATRQGQQTTYDAIQRAAVLCYATEGYYPPGLSYIEERYGVQVDYDNYLVLYEPVAPNIMPSIYVFPKN